MCRPLREQARSYSSGLLPDFALAADRPKDVLDCAAAFAGKPGSYSFAVSMILTA
jgi:hypothetical protein